MHHLASSTLGVQRTFRNLSLKTEQEGSRGIWQKDRIHRKKKMALAGQTEKSNIK